MKCCPTCGQQLPPKLVVHGTVRQRIVDILAARPHGYTSTELMGLVYADDPDGGPDDSVALRVSIYNANKELAKHGYRIKATNPGRGARYQLVSLWTSSVSADTWRAMWSKPLEPYTPDF